MNPNDVTVTNPADTVDRYGDTIDDWDNATIITLVGAVIAPELQPENNELGRVGIVTSWSLYTVDVDLVDQVTARSRIGYNGDTYRVQGTPAHYHHPRTGRHVTHIALERVEG